MGLILWIDANTFATSLLDKVFKTQGGAFYSLGSVDDFSYIVEDLKPVAIVLDYSTFKKNADRFYQQLESSELMKVTPFILLDDPEKELKLNNIIGYLKRPFDPFEIPAEIQKIISTQ